MEETVGVLLVTVGVGVGVVYSCRSWLVLDALGDQHIEGLDIPPSIAWWCGIVRFSPPICDSAYAGVVVYVVLC